MKSVIYSSKGVYDTLLYALSSIKVNYDNSGKNKGRFIDPSHVNAMVVVLCAAIVFNHVTTQVIVDIFLVE